ncbi:replication-relaxation family protein [Streptomyces sp. NPDC096934]|uniref:replication-relaxation family protein n=1 Tax=Streptomyces sp. NPDC096934 TaxID=3155551 RepID=UPI003316CCFD
MLAALGVLKVASADQIRRLTYPGHKDSRGLRNACLDLAKHGLTQSDGYARDGQKLWGLTTLGLTAAAEALGRPAADMGGTARGAARSGAPHAMAVNETVIALTGTQPVPTRPIARTTPAPAAAPGASAESLTLPATAGRVASPVPAGFGSVASWATEVVHPLPGVSRTRPSVRADAVLRAPEAGLPTLLVEVDRCTEADDVLAAKFARYREFFRVKVKDHSIAALHGGQHIPLWESFYPPTGREGYPPIAVVFDPGTRLGDQALKNRMKRVLDLTREHWTGSYKSFGGYDGDRSDGYAEYDDAIPVIFTTLARLQDLGPLAAVWWRCGHRRWETLADALDNPDDRDAWRRRSTERHEAREEEGRAREQGTAREATSWAATAVSVPAQPDPAPPLIPACETCGGLLKVMGRTDPSALPPDARICDACRRLDTAQPIGLLKALFGRPDKDTPPRPQPDCREALKWRPAERC